MQVTSKFSEAFAYARQVHEGQFRKGTDIPYISHLMAVAILAMEYGGDENQAIAALLHDAVEDGGKSHGDVIFQFFGKDVADIVLACTDGTMESKAKEATSEEEYVRWKRRKEQYLDHLPTKPDRVLLVSCCDKLHNATAILADLRRPGLGINVFERFTGRLEGTLWYYGELVRIFEDKQTLPAPALRKIVDELRVLALR